MEIDLEPLKNMIDNSLHSMDFNKMKSAQNELESFIKNPDSIIIFIQLLKELFINDNVSIHDACSLYIYKLVLANWLSYSHEIQISVLDQIILGIIYATSPIQINCLSQAINHAISVCPLNDFNYYFFYSLDPSISTPLKRLKACSVLMAIPPPQLIFPKIIQDLKFCLENVMEPDEILYIFSLLLKLQFYSEAASMLPRIYNALYPPNNSNSIIYSSYWMTLFHNLPHITTNDTLQSTFIKFLQLAFQIISEEAVNINIRFILFSCIFEFPSEFNLLTLEDCLYILHLYLDLVVFCAEKHESILFEENSLFFLTVLLKKFSQYPPTTSDSISGDEVALSQIMQFFSAIQDLNMKGLLISLNLLQPISEVWPNFFNDNFFHYFFPIIKSCLTVPIQAVDYLSLTMNCITNIISNLSDLILFQFLHQLFPQLLDISIVSHEDISNFIQNSLLIIIKQSTIPDPSLLSWMISKFDFYLSQNPLNTLLFLLFALQKCDPKYILQNEIFLSFSESLFIQFEGICNQAFNDSVLEIIGTYFEIFGYIIIFLSDPLPLVQRLLLIYQTFFQSSISDEVFDYQFYHHFFKSVFQITRTFQFNSYQIFEPIFPLIIPYIFKYEIENIGFINLIIEYWPELYSKDFLNIAIENCLDYNNIYFASLITKVDDNLLFFEAKSLFNQKFELASKFTLQKYQNDTLFYKKFKNITQEYYFLMKKIKNLKYEFNHPVVHFLLKFGFNTLFSILKSMDWNYLIQEQDLQDLIFDFLTGILFMTANDGPFTEGYLNKANQYLRLLITLFLRSSINSKVHILFTFQVAAIHNWLQPALRDRLLSVLFSDDNILINNPFCRCSAVDFMTSCHYFPIEHFSMIASWFQEELTNENNDIYQANSFAEWLLMTISQVNPFPIDLAKLVIEQFPPVSKSQMESFTKHLITFIQQMEPQFMMALQVDLQKAVERFVLLPIYKKRYVPNEVINKMMSLIHSN